VIAALLAGAVLLVCAAGITIRKDSSGRLVRKCLIFFSRWTGPVETKTTAGDRLLPVEAALHKKLLQLECRPTDIKSHGSADGHDIMMQASVPRGRPLEWVVCALSQVTKGTSYAVSDCIVDEKKLSATITFSSHAKNNPRCMLTITCSERFYSGTARMALIVENLEDTSYQCAVSILSFSEPLSVSVMPGSKKAALIAQLADQHQKEIIIRLPMEPQGKVPAGFEQSAIMVHYSKDAILAIVSAAVKDIPNFTGFGNAWGSRACEDSRVMNIVLADVRKQHGYFIETKTTKNSVVASVATALDCPFSEVNARIDKKTAPDIAAELRRLGASAQASGTFVATAAASRQLWDALTAVRPWLKQAGVRLVFVSEIVKHPHD
jgi:polysaccharide deacetylase 2 family uncharacterized protein YibQ